MKVCRAWIGIGSNTGDRMAHFQSAVQLMQEKGVQIIRISPIYESEPVGFPSETLFLNAVIEINWNQSPEKLLAVLLSTETEMGRTRDTHERYTSRSIDLDILLFENEVINTPELTVPHPRLHERNFVLTPLYELIPDYVHPILNQRIRVLKNNCIDENKLFVHDKALSVNR